MSLLLASGLVMVIGEPARALANGTFQLKMLLIVAALVVMRIYQARTERDPTFGDSMAGSPGSARVLAGVALALWVGIILAGRWIAYT